MKSIIFDSSVWIDHFNRKETPQSLFLSKLLLNKQRVCITPIIAQEILQGIKSDNLFDVCEMVLSGQYLLAMDAWEAVIQSANLYRLLRKKGVTIRKANDCLIAAYALHFKVELCHNDSDFDLIAANFPLKIWKP